MMCTPHSTWSASCTMGFNLSHARQPAKPHMECIGSHRSTHAHTASRMHTPHSRQGTHGVDTLVPTCGYWPQQQPPAQLLLWPCRAPQTLQSPPALWLRAAAVPAAACCWHAPPDPRAGCAAAACVPCAGPWHPAAPAPGSSGWPDSNAAQSDTADSGKCTPQRFTGWLDSDACKPHGSTAESAKEHVV